MNQKKIGAFLKELRREKNMTQEQLAEVLGVSGRTVSRWETGFNMPDLSILVQIADYYEVDLREIMDGERKSEKMDKELEETVKKVADYSNEEKACFTRRLHVLFMVAVVTGLINFLFLFVGVEESGFVGFVKGFTGGITYGMVLVGAIMTSRYAAKIRAFKWRWLKKQS